MPDSSPQQAASLDYSDGLCLDLVGLLYDQSTDLSNWVEFLERLAACTRSRAAMMRSSNQHTGEGRVLTGARMTPQQLADYRTLYHPAAIRAFSSRNPRFTTPGTVTAVDLATLKGQRTGALLARRLQSISVGHLINCVVDVDGPTVLSLTAVREPGAPPFGSGEVALFRRLLPHVRRAALMSRHLQRVAQVNAALLRSLDHLAVGVVLLRRDGKVVTSNRAADALFVKQDGIWVGPDGQLRSTAPETAQALLADIRRVLAETAPGPLSRVVPRATGTPLLALVVALGSQGSQNLAGGPYAAVYLSAPHRPLTPPITTLRALWGLTPAEARVARALITGDSLPQVAQRLGVKTSTVRTHVNRIFTKTGTRRQGELIGLLACSVAAMQVGQQALPAGLDDES